MGSLGGDRTRHGWATRCRRFDLQAPLLSLPRLLGGLGAPVPYLAAEPERVAKWRDRVGAQGLRVGIAWQGNPASAGGVGPLDPAARSSCPLAQVPGSG